MADLPTIRPLSDTELDAVTGGQDSIRIRLNLRGGDSTARGGDGGDATASGVGSLATGGDGGLATSGLGGAGGTIFISPP